MNHRKENVFEQSNQRRKRAQVLIPGGSHTYSKGDDQFPQLSPHSIVRGKGARIWDVDGNEFVDWGMGLTSVILGHAYEPVLEAIRSELENGVNFIRPSHLELELAELVHAQIPCAEMVKFAKNGSDATSAAVRLARAYTGKKIILRCADQPFFSIHDWFIGDTAIDAGVPEEIKRFTKRFKFNDLADFENALQEHQSAGIACAILQPVDTVEPKPGYLQGLKDLCDKHGIVLIFDEVVTGFRWHPKGAQHLFGVTPHLAAFGKAMANGFSISALAGIKAIMSRGGLDHAHERVFLMSTTYGAETHHLRAAQKTMEILNGNDYEVTRHLWAIGKRIKDFFNQKSKGLGIDSYATMTGMDCKPVFVFKNDKGEAAPDLRTLFSQEMIRKGVIIQNLIPSFSHGDSEASQTEEAIEHALTVLCKAIEKKTVEGLLEGPTVRAVFRKYN